MSKPLSTSSSPAAFGFRRSGPAQSSVSRWTARVSAWAGAVLLVVSSVIHLHLWLSGYRHIPTIGPLFLAQVVGGIALSAVVALKRSPVFLAGGAVFAAGTVVALLVSVNFGLFGFRDSLDAPYAKSSLVVECAAAVLFAVAATVAARAGEPVRPSR